MPFMLLLRALVDFVAEISMRESLGPAWLPLGDLSRAGIHGDAPPGDDSRNQLKYMFASALMKRDVLAHGPVTVVHEAVCIGAAIVGDLPGLQRLAEQMFLCSKAEVELAAALYGHVNILDWTHTRTWAVDAGRDVPWDDARVLNAAVMGRQAAVVRWVVQRTQAALTTCRDVLDLHGVNARGHRAWLDAVIAGGAVPAEDLASDPVCSQPRASATSARAVLAAVAPGHMPPAV